MAGLAKFFGYLFSGQFGRIAGALAERTPLWLFHRWDASIFEATLSGPVTAPELPPGYRCRVAEANDLEALSRLIGVPHEEYSRRVDSGDFCFAVFEGARPANLNWIHLGPCYVRGAGFEVAAAPADAYIYGIYTDPSERGKGLYKKCLLHLANHLLDNGSGRLIQMVEDGNAPVLHTLPQLGYRKTVTLRHRRWFGVRYTRWVDDNSRHVQRRWFCRDPKGIFPI
jgi:GNAT superfamily N-acetyltransferase